MSDDELDYDFPGAPQQVEFWSLAIPPNKTVQAELSALPGLMEIAHVTSAALDEHAKPGRHVVKIIPMDETNQAKPEVALGTLELGRTDQFAVDFGFSSTMGFRHTGKSTVHLSGYMTRSYGEMDEDDSEDYENESESESESESDDAEPPAAVPLQQNGKVTPVKGPSKPAAATAVANGPAAAAAGDSSSEEDESEEGASESDEDESDEQGGEDEDMMGDEYDRRLGAKSFGGGSSSGEDESEDEGESESDDPMNIGSDDMVAGVEYADAEAEEDDEGESSDDDEGESSDDDEEDEDESSEDDEQPQQQFAAKGKRPASQPMTPQPKAAKKQKANEGKPVPVSAPAKGPVSKTGGAGGDAASQYMSALVNELKKSGSMPLSTLASKVKKPQEVPTKFKVFLTQHADTFKLDGEIVSLKNK